MGHVSGEAASAIFWQPQLGWPTPFTTTLAPIPYCFTPTYLCTTSSEFAFDFSYKNI